MTPKSVSIQLGIKSSQCKIWDQDGKLIPFVQNMHISILHTLHDVPRATLTIPKMVSRDDLTNTYVFEPNDRVIWEDIPVTKFTPITE
jgi:hypothetical protein